MRFFSSTETANDVRRDYTSRINSFFRGMVGSSHESMGINDNPLDELFRWAQNASESSKIHRSERDTEVNERQRAEKQNLTLRHEIESMAEQLRQASSENKSLLAKHAHDMEKLVTGHSRDHQVWESEKKQLLRDHKKTTIDANAKHTKEMNKLIGQLLVNQEDNLGWTDDKLKVRYSEIHRKIEAITSPRRKELHIPANQSLTRALDPSGFIGRVGAGKLHILLKSLLWNTYWKHFFSSPYGFGALGPTKGKAALLELLSTRQRLLSGREHLVAEDDMLVAFAADKLANSWRSSTFQSIIAATDSSSDPNSADLSEVAVLHNDNVSEAVNRIMTTLRQIATLAGATINERLEQEIVQVTNGVSELAFQFGVHPAHLEMKVPFPGDRVQIGPEYHECDNGDNARGTTVGVDLMVFPGLQKIGDGRSDMVSRRIIVPCEIYPVRK